MHKLKDLSLNFTNEKAKALYETPRASDKFLQKLDQIYAFREVQNIELPRFLVRIIRKFASKFGGKQVLEFFVIDGIVHIIDLPSHVKVNLEKCGISQPFENGHYMLHPYLPVCAKSTFYDGFELPFEDYFNRVEKGLGEIRHASFSNSFQNRIYGSPIGHRFDPNLEELFYDKYKLLLALQIMSNYNFKFYYDFERTLIIKNSNVTFYLEPNYA